MSKTLYFFGSDECDTCVEYKKLIFEDLKFWFAQKHVETIYIDAFADKNEDFCDAHNVDDIPHVKLYDDKKLLFEHVGPFPPRMLSRVLNDETKQVPN